MLRRVGLLLLLTVTLLSFTGCSDARDLDTRVYLTAIGVDSKEDGFGFFFQTAKAVGVTNAVENNSVEYSNYFINSGDLASAMAQLEQKLTSQLDTEHLTCIVIGEEASNLDILSILEPLFEDPTARRRCAVFCSDVPAAELFAEKDVNALFLSQLVENSTGGGNYSSAATLWKLFCAKETGCGYHLYRIGESESAVSVSDVPSIGISGAFAYNSDAKVCSFDSSEAQLLRLLTEKAPKGIFCFSEGEKLCFEIVDSSMKTKLNEQSGELEFVIEITAVCSDLSAGDKDVRDFENEALEFLSQKLNALVDRCLLSGAFGVIGLEQEYRQTRYDEFISLSSDEKHEKMMSIPIRLKLEVRSERAEGYR